MSGSDDLVWSITKNVTGEPRLDVGEMLKGVEMNEYLPSIADELVNIARFMYNVCIENSNIVVQFIPNDEQESTEDYEFE